MPRRPSTLSFPGGSGFDRGTYGDDVSVPAITVDVNGNIVGITAVSITFPAAVSLVDFKDSVRVATTTAGTLATSFENGDTVDGVVLATGNRILIKDQATASENGIYTVNASGAPTRATDFDVDAEVTAGCIIPVTEGTANADKLFILTTNDPITLGTTSLSFSALSASASAAWSALTDPAGNLSLAMGANLTTFTVGGNYGSASAWKIAGANTSATGPLVEFSSGVSNNMSILKLTPRGGRSFDANYLGSLLLGKDAPGNTDADGYVYLGVIGSNLFPSGTPTSNAGFAPITLQANGTAGDYSIWAYLGSAWRDLGGQHKRYDTGSGTGAQTIDFNSSTSANVSRQFTLTGNVTFTFSNPPKTGSLVTLIIVQDGTGTRTVTWPSTVKWDAGTAPVLSVAAGAKDVFQFVYDGSNYLEISRTLMAS